MQNVCLQHGIPGSTKACAYIMRSRSDALSLDQSPDYSPGVCGARSARRQDMEIGERYTFLTGFLWLLRIHQWTFWRWNDACSRSGICLRQSLSSHSSRAYRCFALKSNQAGPIVRVNPFNVQQASSGTTTKKLASPYPDHGYQPSETAEETSALSFAHSSCHGQMNVADAHWLERSSVACLRGVLSILFFQVLRSSRLGNCAWEHHDFFGESRDSCGALRMIQTGNQ